MPNPLNASPRPKPTAEYEVAKVRLDRMMPRNAVRKLLSDHAEYGGWELSRLRRYRDGTREVWLRRKVIRAAKTLQVI